MPKPNPPITLMNEYHGMIATGFFGRKFIGFSAYLKILLSDRMMKKKRSPWQSLIYLPYVNT